MLAILNQILNQLRKEEEGQDLAEYALLLVFIAVVVAIVLPGVGTAISGIFTQIVTALGGAAPGG